MAEGLDDALALAARLPWPAVSAGGRGGFFDVDLARWLPSLSAVDVWSTLDEAGIEAARTLTRRVARLGGVSGIKRLGAGTTPAEAGGPFAPLDAAAVESSAADLERGGLPTWEARRLASVILGQVLHLADGTLHATREGIPRPAPAGNSPLFAESVRNRAGAPIFAVDGGKPRRALRPVAAFFSAGRCPTLPRPLESPEGERPSPSVPPSAGPASPPIPLPASAVSLRRARRRR